jgi:hypothetical protein
VWNYGLRSGQFLGVSITLRAMFPSTCGCRCGIRGEVPAGVSVSLQHVPPGTGTAVTPGMVVTSMAARPVPVTLVHVYGIQGT